MEAAGAAAAGVTAVERAGAAVGVGATPLAARRQLADTTAAGQAIAAVVVGLTPG